MDAIRPETRSLLAFVEASLEQQLANGRETSKDPHALLFLGNWHEAFPVLVFQDPVLESVDRNTWAVLKISTHGHKAVAFPSYEQLCRTGNIGSRATLARSLAILRLTRWITLHRRVRDAKGRWRGNVYILHDEPLPLADTLHLDPEYMGFLREATTHRHRRVQTVAREVLLTIEADIGAGRDVTAPEPALERRAAAVQALDEFRTGNTAEGTRRYFSLTKESLFRLYLARRQGVSNAPASSTPAPVQNLHAPSTSQGNPSPRSDTEPGLQPIENHSSSNFELPCSSSYINTTTTTTTDGADAELTLAFPEALSSNERQLASLYLRRVPEARRQAVLDALAHRLKAIARGAPPLVYGAIPYLKALCERARNGTLDDVAPGPAPPSHPTSGHDGGCADAQVESPHTLLSTLQGLEQLIVIGALRHVPDDAQQQLIAQRDALKQRLQQLGELSCG